MVTLSLHMEFEMLLEMFGGIVGDITVDAKVETESEYIWKIVDLELIPKDPSFKSWTPSGEHYDAVVRMIEKHCKDEIAYELEKFWADKEED